jgi:cell shape-determining protein MreC
MDYGKLLDKYNILLKTVDRLTKENRRLKAKLGLQEAQALRNTTQAVQIELVPDGESSDIKHLTNINSTSDSTSKIRLFMSLFKGRKNEGRS